ncbi:TPA: efflux RND transporter periplasmic adaptor subunit [Candidatus Poribacteria bacterium]|nr:efflux RND transporter periplasmic adaptor subunit [Candidatus Poribacteria bacterium]
MRRNDVEHATDWISATLGDNISERINETAGDKMRKWIVIGILILALGLGAFLGKGKIFSKSESEAAEFQTATVQRGDITVTVEATGTIEPLTIVEVKSKASGKIIKMPVEEGDTLKEGDLIAEIEKTYVQADVDKAQADLAAAKARLAQAKTNLELQKQQYEIQLKQAEERVKSAQARVDQLKVEMEQQQKENDRAIEEARANLESAKLQLKLAREPRPEEVKRAEASVAQAKANLDLLRAEYERTKTLYEKGFVPKSELDSAKSKLETARAQYNSSLEQLNMVKNPSRDDEIRLAQLNVKRAELAFTSAQERAKTSIASLQKSLEQAIAQLEDAKANLESVKANQAQIKLREKDVESAQASVVRAEVALKSAQDRLADTLVTAPIFGTILKKYVEEGQVISSSLQAIAGGGTPLVTMADLGRVYVKVDVDETQVGLVKPGQPVSIVVDAYPDRTFEGVVLKIAPQGETIQNVTTFKVTTEIKNPSGILKPGMNATVEITVADKKGVLLLPNEAIKEVRGRKLVIPVVNGKPGRPRMIETGVTDYEYTEVISGLSEGDVVMIGGFPKLTEGNRLPPWMRGSRGLMGTFGRMQREARRREGGGGRGAPPPPPPGR